LNVKKGVAQTKKNELLCRHIVLAHSALHEYFGQQNLVAYSGKSVLIESTKSSKLGKNTPETFPEGLKGIVGTVDPDFT
jgi:hypothetical protein